MPEANQTYTYVGPDAPDTTDVDLVRFTLQDTGDLGLWLLSDQELQYLIDTWRPRYSSLTFVAAIAAATISRKFAGIVTVSADGVSVNTSELSANYRQLAVDLREEYKEAQVGGEIDISNLLIGYGVDPDIKPLRFGVGLHDNPEVGLQDYGGWSYDPFQLIDSVMTQGNP